MVLKILICVQLWIDTKAVVSNLYTKIDILCDMKNVPYPPLVTSIEGIDKFAQVTRQKLDSFLELVKNMPSACSSGHSSHGKQIESESGSSLSPIAP